MKMKFKRILSGVMAVATLASVIVQPMTVSASAKEPDVTPFEQQYPKLKEVQDSLDADEIVTANDIELSYGEEFEVEVDLSGIEGVNESKLKVLFHEAKNKDGTDFDTHTSDTFGMTLFEFIIGSICYKEKWISKAKFLKDKVSKNIVLIIAVLSVLCMLLGHTLLVQSLFVAPVTGLLIIFVFSL